MQRKFHKQTKIMKTISDMQRIGSGKQRNSTVRRQNTGRKQMKMVQVKRAPCSTSLVEEGKIYSRVHESKVLVLFYFETSSHYSPGWPQTHNLSASASKC
jgi:hypothetical protein